MIRKRGYYPKVAYEVIYDIHCNKINENVFEALRHKNVLRYRVRMITSGKHREYEIYPVWDTKKEAEKAENALDDFDHKEYERTGDYNRAQKIIDERNSRKRLVRLLNCNFTEKDLAITLTYAGDPPDEAQARKDIRNYLRRVRAYRQRQGLPELKYIYVIEFDDGSAKNRPIRIHHHIVMSDMDRDDAEKLWGKGRANTKRLQPDKFGFEAIGRYIIKDPKGRRRWCGSKNLAKPKVTVAECKMTRRQVEILAGDVQIKAPGVFERFDDKYEFNDCELRRSEYVAGAYIYARMRRKE